MECYKVLSTPIETLAPNYKGLYRNEPPYPQSENNKQFIFLGEKYILYYEESTELGITKELTIDELKYLASLATQDTGDRYEVIFFSEHKKCPHQSEYYGIDVAGVGRYSMLGENCFPDCTENGTKHLLDVLNLYFRARLNTYGLFDKVEDAESFRTVLNDLNSLSPGCVEQEDWQIIHIFKLC